MTVPMPPGHQTAITTGANLANQILQMLVQIDGQVDILQTIFAGSTGDTLIIDGQQVDQTEIDSIDSFKNVGLTTTNVVNGTYSPGAIRDAMKSAIGNLRQLTKVL